MKIRQKISEIAQAIIPAWGPWAFTGIRSKFRAIGQKFFGDGPTLDKTMVSYDRARSLYYNNGSFSLGSHFAKPIVDLSVDFMGLPTASTEDEQLDDFLNDCLHIYWADTLQQMFRNSIRESVTLVRVHQDDIDDPLLSIKERPFCRLEIIPADRVVLTYDPINKNVLQQAVVKHKITLQQDPGDYAQGMFPKEVEIELWEVITRFSFRYFDVTHHQELTSWARPNPWGFVPLEEVFNEYDSALSGGQSDLESVYPFIQAFHNLLDQGTQAHKYHSIPKVKFKLQDVMPFMKNNFPTAFDENGNLLRDTEISWKGKEIIFLDSEEDAEFLEARSVLGDTKTLGDFLIDCICVASETPKWAFMLGDATNAAENAQALPFVKKIGRKRINFAPHVQRLLKMVAKINSFDYSRPTISWEIVRVQDQAAYNQALQMLIMGLEVAAQRQIISDSTYRELLRMFIPQMKEPSEEEADAKSNFDPIPPPANSNGSGNPKNVPVGGGQQGRNE
jgi:hypothetical protein